MISLTSNIQADTNYVDHRINEFRKLLCCWLRILSVNKPAL